MPDDLRGFELNSSELATYLTVLGNTFAEFQEMAEDPNFYRSPSIDQIVIPSTTQLAGIFATLVKLHTEGEEVFNAIVGHYHLKLSEAAALELINYIGSDRVTTKEQLIYLVLITWITGGNFKFIYFSGLSNEIIRESERLIAVWEVKLGKDVDTSALDSSKARTDIFPRIYVPDSIHQTFQNLFQYTVGTEEATLSRLIRRIIDNCSSTDIDYILALMVNLRDIRMGNVLTIYDLTVDYLTRIAGEPHRLNPLQELELSSLRSVRSTASIEVAKVSMSAAINYQPRIHDARLVLNELVITAPKIPQVVEKLTELLNPGLALEVKRRNLKLLLEKALDLKDADRKERDLLFASLVFVINQAYPYRASDPELTPEILELYHKLFAEI